VKIGVIAEDDSDVMVVKELTRSLIKPRKIGFKRFVGNGCGKLRRKCAAWAENLARQGCPWIVLVHDLDDYDETTLRVELTKAVSGTKTCATVVLIPRREIESWLLYDADAIAKAFSEKKKVKLPHDPESLPDPKKYLSELVDKEYEKQYLNTKHNELIARLVNISMLRRSGSFAPYPYFVSKQIWPALGGRLT
jgi:hypothetical protein